jgi:hypothetical protein
LLSDLKAPTYKNRPHVGRAFMVRRFTFSRSDIFEGRWSMRKMSDLKAPTYEDRSLVGRAFMVRRFILSRSDIFMRRWRTKDV